MKLFDFLKRKKEDVDEDDDIDFDVDDDGPRTEVIDDDIIHDSEIEDALASDRDTGAPDEELIGQESEIPDFEDDPVFGDDDDDDEEDEEAEAEETEGGIGRNSLLFIFAGAIVLIIGIIGGAGFWILGGTEEPVAEKPAPIESSDTMVAISIAPRNPQAGGGLNAIGIAGVNPPAQSGSVASSESSAQSGETRQDGAAPVGQPVAQQTPEQQKALALASITGVGEGGSLNAAAATVPRDNGQGLVVPSVTAVSYQKLSDQERVVPLASAPDQNLVEVVAGLENPLPVIGPEGRLPWQVYARPFVEETANPKVAIIVKGLGYSRAGTMAAIKKLPGEVSLAFSPYVQDLNDWNLRARLSGHEVFLELPMESKNFPREDAGPLALNTGLQVSDNIKQLNNVMSRMTGYVGLLSVMGSKFNEAEGQLKPILTEIKNRGLLFVDGGGGKSRARRVAAEIGLPKAFTNVYLDEPPSRRAMDQKLQGLDQLVRQQAAAIAVIHAYPNSIERILIWIRTMEQRNLTLVPVSALADMQFIQ